MLDVILAKVLAIAVDPGLVAAAGTCIATDQEDRIEQLGMLEAEHDRDARADAAPAKHGAFDLEIVHYPDHVLRHVHERIGPRHLGRAPVAADIDADHGEPGREMRGLVHPQVVVERVGMDEHHRRAVASDLVPDVDAVRLAVGHQTLALMTAVGCSCQTTSTLAKPATLSMC